MKKPVVPARVIPGGPNVPVPVKAPAGHHQAKPRQTPAQARKAHRARVAAARKGAATRKKTAAKRKLALGEGVACCAAEALAASLRLAGGAVSDEDVLALYRHTADDPDTGATIVATLEAASEYGLAGVKPLNFREVMPDAGPECRWRELPGLLPHETRAGLILGADLPGPHAVLAVSEVSVEPLQVSVRASDLSVGPIWWSWGEPYDPAAFPGAVVEEMWEVRWQ